MNTKASLPTTTIIIAIVVMLIVTAVIFLALPLFEDKYGEPGKCEDTCFLETDGVSGIKIWMDCDISTRKIIYYPNGISPDHKSFKWQYADSGYTSYYEPLDVKTLAKLVERVTNDYDNGVITEASYHWFMCTAEAID